MPKLTKNWDENANWIGDNIPDSTRDWSVKNKETASVGDFISVSIGVGALLFNVALIVGIFTGLVWVALFIIGIV